MHKTPIHDEHVILGAKMVWFAGWDMPIQYTSIIDEHMTVRQHSGAFDVSHMGDFLIKGKDAGAFLDSICTNDISSQTVGRCVYSHLLDDQGMILDDTIITVLGEDEFLMVPNAATTQKMHKWVEEHLRGQTLIDESTALACIAVQGPTAKDVVAQLTTADLSPMKFFWASFVNLDKLGTRRSAQTTNLLRGRHMINEDTHGICAFVSRTGYTGEDGFEIIVENADAVTVWTHVLSLGAQFGLKPVGLGARDTLRLEKALLLSGTDFDGSQTSLQTGPGWVIDWKHDFIGKKVLERQKASGSYDKLVCMLAKDRGIPRHGYDIMTDGVRVGSVTSGTLSPVLKKGIAMGYVPLDMAKEGTEVQIKVRETLLQSEIVRPPFVRRS